MEITDVCTDKNIKTFVTRDILEGLATSWEDCIPEADNNEIAMKKIQTLIGSDYGWESEEEMIKDMANFRRERIKINENNA